MNNLSSHIIELKRSKIKEFNDLASCLNVKYNLAIGEPFFKTPKIIKNKVVDSLNNNLTHYAPSMGFEEVRQKIAVNENLKHGLNYRKENILVTNGSTDALFTTLQTILEEDDEVIIFLPAYNLYRLAVEYSRGKIIVINTEEDRFEINKDKLIKAISSKTKAIIINSPNNPTGIIYNSKSQAIINEIINKYGIWLIIDSVYEEINFVERENLQYLYRNPQNADKLIICHSLSKGYAMTGFRLGFLIGPINFIREALKLHQMMVVSTNSIIQHAIITALDYQNTEMIKTYQNNLEYAYQRLVKMKLEVMKPLGGFYLFPSIKKYQINSWSFCKTFLQKYQTAILPGICFELEGYIRISYCVSRAILEIALDNLEKYLNELS